MNRADFRQGIDALEFNINIVTENYWLIYAAATDLMAVTELI